MEYRYINATGSEIRVQGAWGLVREIREGRLRPEAMIFEDGPGRWVPARQHPDYREALKVIEEMGGAGAQHGADPTRGAPSSFNMPPLQSMGPGPSSRDTSDPRPHDAHHEGPHATPAPVASQGEEDEGFRRMQYGALGATALIAFVLAPGDLAPAGRFGYALGGVAFCAIFASLFLVWTRSTRRHLPFGMLVVLLCSLALIRVTDTPSSALTTAHYDEIEGVIDEIDEQFSLRRMLAAGAEAGSAEAPTPVPGGERATVQATTQSSAPATSPTGRTIRPMADGPPAGASMEERELWVTGQAFLALASVTEEYEMRYELTEEHLHGWLEADYFRNASRYPHVPAFFARNREMVEDMAQNYQGEVIAHLDQLLDRAALPAYRRRAFMAGFDQGSEMNAHQFARVLDTQRELIALAQELHSLLVANEAMISANLTTQEVSIKDERVERRVWALVDQISETYETAATLQEETMAGVRRMLEEERSRVRP